MIGKNTHPGYYPLDFYITMPDQLERVQRLFVRRFDYRWQIDCSHNNDIYLQRLACLKVQTLKLRRIFYDLVVARKIHRVYTYTMDE